MRLHQRLVSIFGGIRKAVAHTPNLRHVVQKYRIL